MFKLIISIDDDGNTNVEHEGKINYMTIVGALRVLEHEIINTAAAERFAEQMNGGNNE